MILTLLGALWARIGATVLKWGGILLAVLGVALYIHRLIIAGERGKQAGIAMEAGRERRNIDRKVDHLTPDDLRMLHRSQQSRFKRQL